MPKKATNKTKDLLPEYDFSQGVRGKYAKSYLQSNNIVVLAKDVAKYFSDSDSVNEALRTMVRVARASSKKIA